MQTVIVAGGAGFIGSHLCEALLKKDYKVICVDNFLTSEKENISTLTTNENFSLIEKDIINLNPDELPTFDFLFQEKICNTKFKKRMSTNLQNAFLTEL